MIVILMTKQNRLASDTTGSVLYQAKYRTKPIFSKFRESQGDLPSEPREALKGYSLSTEAHKLAHKGQFDIKFHRKAVIFF